MWIFTGSYSYNEILFMQSGAFLLDSFLIKYNIQNLLLVFLIRKSLMSRYLLVLPLSWIQHLLFERRASCHQVAYHSYLQLPKQNVKHKLTVILTTILIKRNGQIHKTANHQQTTASKWSIFISTKRSVKQK